MRKYSGEQDLIWGGDPNCQHQWQGDKSSLKKSNQGVGSSFIKVTDKLDALNKQSNVDPGSAFCSLCGAWKGQLGLEPTPDCGRHYLKLRDDLIPKQKEYVLNELRKLGAI